MTSWAEGKYPQLGALWLLPYAEEDVFVPEINRNRFLLKNNPAAMVASCPNAHQVVMELGHYVAKGDKEVGVQEVVKH